MPTEGERLAKVEQQLVDLRGVIDDRKGEEERTRKRLHDIEGVLGLLVDQQKRNREHEATQYRRVEIRMQVLTVVIAFAALAEPFLYHAATSG